MHKLWVSCLLAIAILASGCTRIETGHVGVRTGFSGEVDLQELKVGWHQTVIGTVREFVSNEITLSLSDLHPQTKDRSNLSDLDLTFTYSVDPSAVAELVTKYKGRDLVTDHGVFPVGAYVMNIVQTATGDVIGQYDALDANENRKLIPQQIVKQAAVLLAQEGLDSKVHIHQVFIKVLQVDKSIQASALRVINQQNEYEAKKLEVKTAGQEAERMKAVASQGDAKYNALLNAQSNMKLAEAIAAGKVNTIVVPYDFKGIVNIPK